MPNNFKRGNDFFARFRNRGYPVAIAEGDSWFDYQVGAKFTKTHPTLDLLDYLAVNHDYAIYRVSNAGDTLENMAYGTLGGKTIDKVRQERPSLFFLSAGGNDVVGPEMAHFVNHAQSGLPVLRIDDLRDHLHTGTRRALERIIDRVSTAAPNVEIFAHGYDYPLANGKGAFKLPWGYLKGPWIKPVFKAKEIRDRDEQDHILESLIDEFNDLLQDLDASFANFHHVDLRNQVRRNEWANEIHPERSGFERCAKAFHEKVASVP